MVSKEEEHRLKKVFESLDQDGNGNIDKEELITGLTKLYGEKYAIEEADRIFM